MRGKVAWAMFWIGVALIVVPPYLLARQRESAGSLTRSVKAAVFGASPRSCSDD